MKLKKCALLLLLGSSLGSVPLGSIFAKAFAAGPLNAAEVARMLKTVDDRQRNSGDYKAQVFLEQREQDKQPVVRVAVVYRRDSDDKMMIVFTKPESEAGKGYLRLDRNLFIYDPTTWKWDRRTERERILGTDSTRADFDRTRLSEDFTAKYLGSDTLGKAETHKLELTVKPGIEVAYPIVHVWIDKGTGNMLKQQEFALSGRLMRTSYYPKWEKTFSEAKKSDVYYPREIRIFDEVIKGNGTTILVKEVDLNPLASNIFTKAWLESKSR